MKKFAILGGVALCLSISACGQPSPEITLINALNDAGYNVNESNIDSVIYEADKICDMNQQEFDSWYDATMTAEILMYGEPRYDDDMAWRVYCLNTMPEGTYPVWNFN